MKDRVLRGGSYYGRLRSTFRKRTVPEFRRWYISFRVVVVRRRNQETAGKTHTLSA